MDLTLRSYDRVKFMRISMAKADVFDDVDFVDCVFTKSTFAEVAFERCRFTNCNFNDCDLSLASVKDSGFTNTVFRGCKLLGIHWVNTAWAKARVTLHKPVSFEACTLNYGVFIGMNLRKLQLTQCTAHEAGFEDASLIEADLRGSDFSGSRFARADVSRADLRGATNYALSPLGNKLKGAKFSLPEALTLLHGLEIELEA